MSESIIQSLSANVLRLGNEVRDLTKERDALKEHIRYLEIELTTETARWEGAMQEVERLRASSFVTAVPCEEYDKLKAENDELHADYEALADEHTKLRDQNARLKAEVLTESQRWKQIADRWIPCNDMLEENARLKAENERSVEQYNSIIDKHLDVIADLKAKVEHIDLLKSVVEKFFNSADLKNSIDAQSYCALAEKLKQLPDCILDFTEEQVRDNPAWALAVFRHKVKEMKYQRVHDLNAIGGEQEENARLKAENERLTQEYSDATNHYNKLFNDSKAEVERLRKAGDAIDQAFKEQPTSLYLIVEALRRWNAAKDGKDADGV